MPGSVPFWFASRSDYEIKDDRVAAGAPLLVIRAFSPQRGSHKSAQRQGASRRCESLFSVQDVWREADSLTASIFAACFRVLRGIRGCPDLRSRTLIDILFQRLRAV